MTNINYVFISGRLIELFLDPDKNYLSGVIEIEAKNTIHFVYLNNYKSVDIECGDTILITGKLTVIKNDIVVDAQLINKLVI